MNSEWQVGEEVKGTGHGLILATVRVFYLEGLRKTVKNLGQYSRCAGRDLKCTLMNAKG